MAAMPDVDSDVELTINPLHLPLVLKNVLGHLTPLELTQARTICHQWNQMGTELLRDKIHEIKLTFFADYENTHLNDAIMKEEELVRDLARAVGGLDVEIDDDADNSADSDSDDSWESVSTNPEPCSVLQGNPKLSRLQQYLCYIHPEGETLSPPLRFTNISFKNLKLKHELVIKFFQECGTDIKILEISLATQRHNHFGGGMGFDDSDDDDDVDEDDNDRYGSSYLDDTSLRRILFEYCTNLDSLELSALPQNVTLNGFLTPSEVDDPPSTKIKSLKIHHNYRTLRLSNNFLRDMLLICPLLEESAFIADYDSYGHDYRFFMTMESTNRLEKLTVLSLNQVDQRIIRTLKVFKNRLKLKSFKVETLLPTGVEEEFLEFLTSQSTTLEILLIRKFSTQVLGTAQGQGIQGMLTFPQSMPKLKWLRMGLGFKSFIKFSPMDLSTQFPSLKTLLLPREFGNVNVQPFFQSNDQLKTLETLELPVGCLDLELISRIGNMFPNVKNLCVGFQRDAELSQILSNNWPELETLFLCLYPAHDLMKAIGNERSQIGMDALFTGFSPEQIKLAMGSNCYVDPIDIGPPSRPSIANFKKLRQLTLHPGPERNLFAGCRKSNDLVTGLSFDHAFCKLSALEYLSVRVANDVDRRHCLKICQDVKLLNINCTGSDDGDGGFSLQPLFSTDTLEFVGEHFCKRPFWGYFGAD